MKIRMVRSFLLILATACAFSAAGEVNGKKHKAECLIFVLKDCPIANQYMPEFLRLDKQYGPKGVDFKLVVEDADASPAMLNQIRRDYGVQWPMTIDRSHAMAKRYRASISPTAVVRVQSNTYYVGRIDDTYASIGKRRAVARSHDLRAALDQVLAGKKVTTAKTQAVGCRLY